MLSFSSAILTVCARDITDGFRVHEKLFSSHSSLIRDAVRTETLGRNGPEGPAVCLDLGSKDLFSLYINLTYTGKISFTVTTRWESWNKLIELAILTERLGDTWARERTAEAPQLSIKRELLDASSSEYGAVASSLNTLY